MADAVTSVVLTQSDKRYVVHLTNLSDGTGESAVVKADISGLLAEDAAVPASLDIEQVRWSVQGFTYVNILWGTTNPVRALLLSGNGYEDFRGDHDPNSARADRGLRDPRTATGERDILLTTAGAVSGATYDITLWLRKSPD